MNEPKSYIKQQDQGAESFINEANSFAQIQKIKTLFNSTMSNEEHDKETTFLNAQQKTFDAIKLLGAF